MATDHVETALLRYAFLLRLDGMHPGWLSSLFDNFEELCRVIQDPDGNSKVRLVAAAVDQRVSEWVATKRLDIDWIREWATDALRRKHVHDRLQEMFRERFPKMDATAFAELADWRRVVLAPILAPAEEVEGSKAVDWDLVRIPQPNAEQHISWFIARHIDGESFQTIASRAGIGPASVENAVTMIASELGWAPE